MNFIFLDIDGVLNNLGTVAAYGNPSKNFDPVSVALIEKLCREAPANIVISSSWRNGNTDRLREELRTLAGDELADHVVDETPNLDACRGKEIDRWWDDHEFPHDRYVIIDDDSDMLPNQNFVKTTFEDGFRFRHYVLAMRHLNPEHPDSDRKIIPVTDHEDQ